jgi:hypothetical protein
MGWNAAFSNPSVPPTFDVRANVLVAGNDLTLAAVALLGVRVVNGSGGQRVFHLEDQLGNVIEPGIPIEAGMSQIIPVPFEPLSGLKCSADVAGLTVHAWGYFV